MVLQRLLFAEREVHMSVNTMVERLKGLNGFQFSPTLLSDLARSVSSLLVVYLATFPRLCAVLTMYVPACTSSTVATATLRCKYILGDADAPPPAPPEQLDPKLAAERANERKKAKEEAEAKRKAEEEEAKRQSEAARAAAEQARETAMAELRAAGLSAEEADVLAQVAAIDAAVAYTAAAAAAVEE